MKMGLLTKGGSRVKIKPEAGPLYTKPAGQILDNREQEVKEGSHPYRTLKVG